jgi:hypothetical protein
MDITYNQVLADEIQESAKHILVVPRTYNYDELEQRDDGLENNELPDPDDFNKFHGDRNKPEHVIIPTTDAASRPKDTRVSVLNIDGRFRSSIIPIAAQDVVTQLPGGLSLITHITAVPASLSSNFIFRTSRQYINVSQVQVSSIEFPNNFYTFSSARNNTSFVVRYGTGQIKTIKIPDGNYTNIVNPTTNTGLLPTPVNGITNDITTLIGSIQQAIDLVGANDPTFLSLINLKIAYDLISHSVHITGSVTTVFTIIFPTTANNCYKNGIGYNLGFSKTSILSQKIVVNANGVANSHLVGAYQAQGVIGDVFPDVIQDRYIFLTINDWNLVEHNTEEQTSFSAFAKIPLTAPKTTIYNDSLTVNTISKIYMFHQPTNINLISVKLVDAYNQVIDMKDSAISLTLEITEVLNSAAYQKLLEL